MNETVKKIAGICKTVFGYGIMITLFIGGFTFFGYIAALIIGGDTAMAICDFIYNKILKYLVYVANSLILLGLFSMYLSGEKALTPSKKEKRKK